MLPNPHNAPVTIGTSAIQRDSASVPPAQIDVVCHGWVLKKRRKKMQGFARRYFVLRQSGILSYSFEPGQPIRDQLSLHHAAISTAPGRKDIHVDSNTATFHMKCLGAEDFDMWMAAFRKFVSLGIEARRSATLRIPTRQSMNIHKSGALAEMLGSTIVALEESIILMTHESPTVSKKHPSLGKKSEPAKDSRFGLFKRSHHTPLQEFGVDSPQTDGSQDNLPPSVQRVLSTLQILKSQHASLLSSLQASNSGSPLLPTTTEEPEHSDDHLGPWAPTISKRSRASVATTLSDSTHEWFDALDGAEEFVMEDHAASGGNGQPSYITVNESQSSFVQQQTDEPGTDSEDEVDTLALAHTPATPQIPRRNRLPAPPTWDEGSLFAILKKNVGKDLSTITFPVTFNEPLTLLQRAAEEVEYYSTLDEAAKSNDPVDRMCYVAAFAVSSYAHTRHRSGRKGFNPMLGETFEDRRMRFIAEKVRHNPLELAYHAEGDGWELTTTSSGKTKFWGKSLEIIPLGNTHVKIGQDAYVWKKPSSFMRNLMVGTKYFEHTGNLTIENTRDDTRCVLEFKQNGYWGPSNVVSGIVYSPSNEILCRLEGKWDDQMAQTFDSSNFRVLWRMASFPKDTDENYGFTAFGITLNEMTEDLVDRLPLTDSRLRPDVRALESGDLDVAEGEKARVEDTQRERRRQGKDREPRWFQQQGDEWVYRGGYWEARARGWKGEDIQPLW